MGIHLPPASHDGELSLERAMAKRRSGRDYAAEPLTLEQLAQLLWAGQGLSGRGFRTVPTAGGVYPVELYVVASRVTDLQPGGYFYSHFEHALDRLGTDLSAPALHGAALSQDVLLDAAAIIVLTAQVERTREVYPADAERYAHVEVGHAEQNILLQAAALGLAAVPIGAFDIQRVAELLGAEGTPVMMVPVGRPTAAAGA